MAALHVIKYSSRASTTSRRWYGVFLIYVRLFETAFLVFIERRIM